MYFTFSQRLTMLFAWTLLIIVLLLSPMPFSAAPDSVTFVDKIVHAFLFGILTFLTFNLLRYDQERAIINPERTIEIKKPVVIRKQYIKINDLLRIFLTTFFISTSLSIVLEYVQVYVPGRNPNDYDLLASVIGIILVLTFIYGNNYSRKEA